MQINISTRQILNVLYVLSWIIFIGVSIDAGGFVCNAVFTLAFEPEVARHLWKQVDLSGLYANDHVHFMVVSFFISLVAILKATLFYLIIKILHDKKLNLVQPFNTATGKFIFNMSYLSLFIGLCSWQGAKYIAWLVTKGIAMPDLQQLRLGGADVWLFMAITLYVIAQIFKKGIEIQTENDLTV